MTESGIAKVELIIPYSESLIRLRNNMENDDWHFFEYRDTEELPWTTVPLPKVVWEFLLAELRKNSNYAKWDTGTTFGTILATGAAGVIGNLLATRVGNGTA